MTARKVVQWVKDNDITPSLYLDQRRVKEVVTASFLNLAELRHLDVQLFLEFYVMYHYIYVPHSMSNKRIITDPILNTKGSKTSHDVLIDTLSRSNNLRFLEGSYTGTPSNHQDLRVALYRSIAKVTSQNVDMFIQSHNVVTPEDTEESYIALVDLQLKSRGYKEMDTSLDISYVKEYVEVNHPGESDEILPEITESEEEVISYLRSISLPQKVPTIRTNYCRYVDTRVREPIHKDLKIAVPCKHKLVRFMGDDTHWVFCALSLWKTVY